MKRILLFAILILLLSSCSQPEETTTVEITPYLSVYNSVTQGEMWVRLVEAESEYYLAPLDNMKRWSVEMGETYHICIRIVEKVSAIENGDCMERIERIAEAKDIEVFMEHRGISISIFKDRGQYVYSLRTWD